VVPQFPSRAHPQWLETSNYILPLKGSTTTFPLVSQLGDAVFNKDLWEAFRIQTTTPSVPMFLNPHSVFPLPDPVLTLLSCHLLFCLTIPLPLIGTVCRMLKKYVSDVWMSLEIFLYLLNQKYMNNNILVNWKIRICTMYLPSLCKQQLELTAHLKLILIKMLVQTHVWNIY
jgi:hypothetical protein